MKVPPSYLVPLGVSYQSWSRHKDREPVCHHWYPWLNLTPHIAAPRSPTVLGQEWLGQQWQWGSLPSPRGISWKDKGWMGREGSAQIWVGDFYLLWGLKKSVLLLFQSGLPALAKRKARSGGCSLGQEHSIALSHTLFFQWWKINKKIIKCMLCKLELGKIKKIILG